VLARYNADIGEGLLEGALSALARHGVAEPEVFSVPGALEIPIAALAAAREGADAVVCLGCVIKGETAHFEYVAGECAAGVTRVGLDSGVPCTFGVLTTYDREQALARSGPDERNKGAEAAETAIEMANLLRAIRRRASRAGS
jgi:6,7-dimethyl-8-ribityllumazine synthase